MNTLSRKQREIKQRAELILDIAEKLVEENGVRALSMDHIAKIAEYSKGTIYQHYPCKEEVVFQLCQRGIKTQIDLFQRATGFDGNSREKLLAIFIAHRLYATLQPTRFKLLTEIHSAAIKEKVCAESLDEHTDVENHLMQLLLKVIFEAIDDGDLTLPAEMNPGEFLFSLWSLSFGGLLLQSQELDLHERGIHQPNKALEICLHAMLDGLHWKPFSNQHDYNHSSQRIEQEIFSQEFIQITQQ